MEITRGGNYAGTWVHSKVAIYLVKRLSNPCTDIYKSCVQPARDNPSTRFILHPAKYQGLNKTRTFFVLAL